MDRHLWILRHGTAEHDRGEANDFTRCLTEKGREEAKNAGGWLRNNDVTFDQIIASPANRTKETALIVGEELGAPREHIVFDSVIYQANRSELLALVSRLSDKLHRVLLVGHNPGVEDFACVCTSDRQDKGVRFLPATLVHIAFPNLWQEALVGLGDFRCIRHVV